MVPARPAPLSRANSYSATVEWHDTPQLWVAYNGCGCAECPKGYGKTKEEAIADLEESRLPRDTP